MVYDLGFMAYGLEFMVYGSWLMIYGLGFEDGRGGTRAQ